MISRSEPYSTKRAWFLPAVSAYLQCVGRRLGAGVDIACRQLDELAATGKRLLIYYWVDDAFSLLAILSHRTEFGSSVSYVCGDTPLGTVTSAVLGRLGRRTLRLRRDGQATRLRDIQRIVREVNPISISADGLGTAFVVSPNLARLAATRGGLVVPLAVCASRCVSLRWCGFASLPLPGARISVTLGAPIDACEYPVEALTPVLDAHLRRAHAEARRQVS